jgi:formylglycine-generating enzyme required for sulfatase activity
MSAEERRTKCIPEMRKIPQGRFRMGSAVKGSESPCRSVFLDAYEIARTQVRRSEYAAFLRETGRDEPRGWNDPAFANPDQPVVGVNWFDAVAYCRWLSDGTLNHFRLPTEAEWEKACLGGRQTIYSWGDRPPDAVEYYRVAWSAPRPVGEGPATGFGLFNMGDNVHEWCLDWFRPGYDASEVMNPDGPASGTRRVSRGGSWRHSVKASRAAARSSLPPVYRYTDYGFRVVRGVS